MIKITIKTENDIFWLSTIYFAAKLKIVWYCSIMNFIFRSRKSIGIQWHSYSKMSNDDNTATNWIVKDFQWIELHAVV